MPHLQVASLKLYYKKDSSVVRAVDGVELAVERGETLGIVGESGCGKSSLASAIFRSFPQNVALFEGSVRLGDVDITRIGEEEFRKDYRWRRIAMVPQSSMNSLDPIYTVGKQMVETIQEHSDMSEREAKELSEGMLREVELPVEVFNRYPFQLSGGQKQRVMIALALILTLSY
jgi:ABC-type dipeptide/oligopeptide/nickel transport system, ATPase component